jgi:acetyl esterase/lipase
MWIHGGGHRHGSASQYGVRHLVNKKMVLVTIQYRLGSLGEEYFRLLRNVYIAYVWMDGDRYVDGYIDKYSSK